LQEKINCGLVIPLCVDSNENRASMMKRSCPFMKKVREGIISVSEFQYNAYLSI